MVTDTVISVRGRVSERDDGRTINLFSLSKLEGTADNEIVPLKLKLAERDATRGVLEQLNRVLASHPGQSDVTIYLIGSSGSAKPFALPNRVRLTNELYAEVKGLLGMDCLMLSEPVSGESLPDGDETSVVVEQTTLLGTDES